MAKVLKSPNINVAKDYVLVVQEATTNIKKLIASKGAKATADIKVIIDKAYINLAKTNKALAIQVKNSLIKSANSWLYTIVQNGVVANANLLNGINKTLSYYNKDLALKMQNKAYISDLTALRSKLLQLPNQAAPVKINQFRGYINTGRVAGLPIIKDYEKQIKTQTKLLASLTPKLQQVTKDGKVINTSLRNKAEMTARYQANVKDVQNLKAAGVKLVWTSSHASASPRCAKWQGKLFSLDGTYGTTPEGYRYQPIENALNDNGGNSIINGYNCRHYLIEYKPKSKPPTSYNKAQIKQEYKIDQKQRYYENEIRQIRAEADIYRNQGNKQQATLLNKKASKLVKDYAQFSLKNKRAYYLWRCQIHEGQSNYY